MTNNGFFEWILFKFVSNFFERAIFLFSNFLLCEQEQQLSVSFSYVLFDIRVPISMVSHCVDLITGHKYVIVWLIECFFFFFIFRCPPDNDLGFPHFAATAQSAGPGGLSSMTSYLKTAPYIMTVDSLHSMGYPTPGKYLWEHVFVSDNTECLMLAVH